MKKITLGFLALVLFTACSFSSEKPLGALPYFDDLSTPKGWSLGAGAAYDAKEGAIKFSKSGDSWLTSDRMVGEIALPVKPNKTYTLSLNSKTSTWPPPALEVYCACYGNDGEIANTLGTMTANSKKDTWEKSIVSIDIPNNDEITSVKIKILDLPKKGKNGAIWIDEIRFEEGRHEAKTAPSKRAFEGTVTRMDALGNLEILKNGAYEPFFPIGIYTDHMREDWSIYKNRGFNTAMWCDNAASIAKAKAVGLYASMQIVQYIMPSDPDWIPQSHDAKIAHLKKTLLEIKNQKLTDNLLFYYIDNEFYHLGREYTEIIDIVIAQDQDANGKRMHPVYMLSGTYGLARMYNDKIDLTGTYAAEDHYETDRTDAFSILNDTQNQTQPAVIAQINRGVENNFRAILYGAIAKGARGAAFWRDGGSVGDVTKQVWWKELPKIKEEIAHMMPLIRVPIKKHK